jgi:Spaetzle
MTALKRSFCLIEELVTPFWAVNGTGVRLAIVNTPPFEQAIHTVKCARGQPARCHPTRPCWCTQEYSWFRLLAYDATDNCKGIFMDWFKFPSHCACKCIQAAAANAESAAAVAVSLSPLMT